jgi:hypothetical protein
LSIQGKKWVKVGRSQSRRPPRAAGKSSLLMEGKKWVKVGVKTRRVRRRERDRGEHTEE